MNLCSRDGDPEAGSWERGGEGLLLLLQIETPNSVRGTQDPLLCAVGEGGSTKVPFAVTETVKLGKFEESRSHRSKVTMI